MERDRRLPEKPPRSGRVVSAIYDVAVSAGLGAYLSHAYNPENSSVLFLGGFFGALAGISKSLTSWGIAEVEVKYEHSPERAKLIELKDDSEMKRALVVVDRTGLKTTLLEYIEGTFHRPDDIYRVRIANARGNRRNSENAIDVNHDNLLERIDKEFARSNHSKDSHKPHGGRGSC